MEKVTCYHGFPKGQDCRWCAIIRHQAEFGPSIFEVRPIPTTGLVQKVLDWFRGKTSLQAQQECAPNLQLMAIEEVQRDELAP